jgi:glutathione S-transferase
MSLTLYYHPLASYCWQPLIALYENDTPFKPYIVDLMDPTSAAAFKKVWPIGKFPVLRDEARGVTVPESTVVIEYLSQYYPGRTRLVPSDSDLAWRVRLSDRFYDHYVNDPMSKVVTDRIRPPGRNDPHGVEEARALLRISLDMVEAQMAGRTWAVGDAFTMADCAAAVLCRQGDAARRKAPARGRLPPPPDAAPVVRPRARGGGTLFQDVPGRVGAASCCRKTDPNFRPIRGSDPEEDPRGTTNVIHRRCNTSGCRTSRVGTA